MRDSVRRMRLIALAFGLVVGGLPAYASTSNYVNYQAVAGDFNGDGWTDVILQPLPGAQGAAELIAYPDGNFGSPLATWPNESGGTNWNADAHRLVVGDFNGDGRDDVLLQGAAGLGSRIAFARPDGDISQTDVALPDTLGGLDPSQASRHLVAGDFNGDGRDDLLLQANTFVGTDGVALAGSDGTFTDLASKWSDGFHGLSWSQDREAITAGDFAAAGSDELLMRSASATGTNACCELIGFDKAMKPTHIVQQWAANFLGVDWQPSTHLAIVGDFNGDAHADILLQPRAPGGEVDLILTDSDGLVSSVADRWSSERDGVDWSSESYLLVPENAAPGQGATLMMVPKQTGLPYRRAQFNTAGQLQSVSAVTPPAAGIFAPAGGSAARSAGGGGLKLHVLAADSPQPGDAVGAMNGQASVSNGVAGYSIKIAVPPGREGMQPSLSLSYSSNGGDGHEGVGWSLGGFSAIYRCPATVASDGVTRGTTFTTGPNGDRLCLDGAKLMLTSGTYGEANSIYHAEVNGFAKIVAHNSKGNGPLYFTVRTADGKTLYYGDSSGSRLLNNAAGSSGSVFTWAINKSVDLHGNSVVYHYNNVTVSGEYYPNEIDYTEGNGGAGTTRKVTFEWEPRSAVGSSNIVHYLDGMTQSTTKLLTHVRTWVGGGEVRDYGVFYNKSVATGRPLVHAIQACAFQAGTEHCFNPTDFTYRGQHVPSFPAVSASDLGLSITSPGCSQYRAGPLFSGQAYDRNGDGRSDLVEYVHTGPASRTYKIQVGSSTGVGFDAPQDYASGVFSGMPIDYNLDGRTDFVAPQGGTAPAPAPSEVYVHYFSQTQQSFVTKDLGINVADEGGGSYPTFTNPLVGDVDGDGKTDLITFTETAQSEYEIQVYLAQGTGENTSYSLSSGFTMVQSQPINYARAIDYDADGKSDLLVHYDTQPTFTLLHSVGDHFVSIPTTIAFVHNPNNQIVGHVKYEGVPLLVADENGDSLPDVLESMDTGGTWQWYAYPNKGNGTFGDPIQTDVPIASAGSYELNQFARTLHDPDGYTDLLIPTARRFFGGDLTDVCGQMKDGTKCGHLLTSGPCAGWWDERQGDGPQDIDGYDWHLYRAQGDGFTYTDMGLVASNIGAEPQVDFNNDGLTDIIGVHVTVSGSTITRAVKAYKFDFSGGTTGAGPSPMPDLLASATNGLGMDTDFNYEPLGQPSVYTRTGDATPGYPDMLFSSPMQVVRQFQESNPTGEVNTRVYTYQDARYNVRGRGFEGFRQISVTDDAAGTTTVKVYSQKFPYTGRVVTSKTFVTGATTPFSASATDWPWPVPITYGAANDKRYLVMPASTEQVEADPAAWVAPHAATSTTGLLTLISETSTTQAVNAANVDACGNVRDSTKTTTTQQATRQVSTSVTFEHWSTTDNNNCWEHVPSKDITTTNMSYKAVIANSTPAVQDELTTTTNYAYNSYWDLSSKDVTSSHNGSAERLTTYGYDSYGNRIKVVQHDGSDTRTATSDYTDSSGYFPLSVTNAATQTTNFTYDAATGNKTTATDPNKITTEYAFDAFGRKQGGLSPGASPVEIYYLDPSSNNYNATCKSDHASYIVYQVQAGYPTTYSCFDKFGDQLSTKTQGFASGDWVEVDTSYNGLGQVLSKSVPYYSAPEPPAQTTYSGYDVLGRLKSKTIPTMDGPRTVAMNYTGLRVDYTDQVGGVTHTYEHFYDGFGKGNGHLVQVEQYGQSDGTYTATYRYDAGGNLIRATDPAGNAITATYDGFGDKLSLSDPDKGDWTYAYDGYGEQTTETNATRQTISTDYDKLGRPIQVSDPADNRVITTTYDTAPDGVGQPAQETVSVNGSVTYSRQYGYDTAGRASVTEITTGGKAYLQGVGYDDDGRPHHQAYPALGGGTNQPPSVTASTDASGPVATQTTVHLVAKGSDPNGSWQLSYHWKQTSGPTAPITDVDGATASVTLNQVGTYGFQVTASDGLSPPVTASVTVEAEQAPTATVTPTVDPSTSETGSFTVSWGTVTNASDYLLQQSKDGGSWSTAYNGSGTSKVLSGRGAGTYRYRVRGYDDVGHAAWGGTATETVVAPPPPQAPLLSPNPSPNGAYTVQWGSVSNADTYKLEESVNDGSGWSSWSVIQNTSALSKAISGVANGDSVRYRVAACNTTTGCSATWSAISTESVEYVPATPTNFHHVTPPILVPPGNAYNLAWDGMQYATSYDLALNGTTATQTGITGTSQTETAPNRYDATDAWRIRACSGGGCSPWSAAIQVSTQPSGGGGCTLACKTPAVLSAPKAAGGSGSPSSELVVDTAYTSTGYPETLTRASDGSVYAQVGAMNAFGQATQVFEGGTSQGTAAVTLTRAYNQATGLVTSIEATNAANTPLATVTSSWDGFGNLASRSMATSDMSGTSTETPTYDKINRLIGSTATLSGGGTTSESYGYDKTGNRTEWDSTDTQGHVTTRQYTYGFGGGKLPHAVKSLNADSGDYAYNANGEVTTDVDRTLQWTAFGKASSITRNNTTVTFAYGPGNSRYRKMVTGPSPETVTYLGGAERLDINGNLSIRRTLSLAGVIIIDTGGAQSKRLYPVADHLGSTIGVVDSTGSLIQGLSYGDFGQRYTSGWNSGLSTSQAVTINQTLTDKGYTGQESLDSVGLDDYNARLYDPGLGRFLSVDPVIGHPESTQSINPYSYVENNPLNKTDPTGDSDVCAGMKDICSTKTKDIKSMSVNSNGSVSVTLNNGKTVTSAVGSMSTGQIMDFAAGVAHDKNLSGNFINLNAMDKAVTGADPNQTSTHDFSLKAMHKGLVAACVYNTKCSGVGYITRQKTYLDNKSGFKAGLFKNGRTGKYIGAFAGVDGFGAVNDWWGSFRQMIGLRSKQFDEAESLARKLNKKFGSALSFTGHSLGGGLATLAALLTHRHATIFNAEWLSNGTIDRYHLNTAMASTLITAYHTGQDPLTAIQHFWPGLNELGRQKELGDGGHGIGYVMGAF